MLKKKKKEKGLTHIFALHNGLQTRQVANSAFSQWNPEPKKRQTNFLKLYLDHSNGM